MLDAIASLLQKSEYSIGTTHVPGTRDNKIGCAAVHVAFKFRNPISVTTLEYSFPEGWEI